MKGSRLKPSTYAAITAFWCDELGVEQLTGDAVQVTEHRPGVVATLTNRIYCLRVGAFIYVTAPPAVVAEIRAELCELARSPFDCLTRIFQHRGRVVGEGPAYIGYRDVPIERSIPVCRVLPTHPLVTALKIVQPLDWEHFGYTPGSRGLFARMDGERLLGLAHYEVWGGTIAHIGVIVDSTARQRGVGQDVVAVAANDALQNGFIPQYRTLHSNVPSMRIAQKLGFEHFADSLVIRYGER